MLQIFKKLLVNIEIAANKIYDYLRNVKSFLKKCKKTVNNLIDCTNYIKKILVTL